MTCCLEGPLGEAPEKAQKGKKGTHLQVFWPKQRFAAEVLRFLKNRDVQTRSGALHTPSREGVCSMIWRFRPETTPKSAKKQATHGTHGNPYIIFISVERKRG